MYVGNCYVGIVTFSSLFCWCGTWYGGHKKLSTNIYAYEIKQLFFCETLIGLRHTLVTKNLKNKFKKVQFVTLTKAGIRYSVAYRNGR